MTPYCLDWGSNYSLEIKCKDNFGTSLVGRPTKGCHHSNDQWADVPRVPLSMSGTHISVMSGKMGVVATLSQGR